MHSLVDSSMCPNRGSSPLGRTLQLAELRGEGYRKRFNTKSRWESLRAVGNRWRLGHEVHGERVGEKARGVGVAWGREWAQVEGCSLCSEVEAGRPCLGKGVVLYFSKWGMWGR